MDKLCKRVGVVTFLIKQHLVVLFKIDFLGKVASQKSVMMSDIRNQNMDSWKSGNRYQVMLGDMSDSLNEFPSLSDASTVKQTKTRGKKNVIKLVVPLKTYKDELREKYTESRPVLENFKTRMCNSLDTDQVCRHGDECRFAHSLEELVIRNCHFKDKCRFVKMKKGKLVNDEINTCRNKHPQESQDDFINRTGLSQYKTCAPKHEEIDEDPNVKHEEVDDEDLNVKHQEIKVDDDEDTNVKHEEIKVESFGCDRQTNYNWAIAAKSFLTQDSCFTKGSASNKFELSVPIPEHVVEPLPPTFKFGGFEKSRTFKFEPSSHEKEIVLRVPKVLAMQALELAMNSGNRCIRVEVIE